jgi:hypothetical protein
MLAAGRRTATGGSQGDVVQTGSKTLLGKKPNSSNSRGTEWAVLDGKSFSKEESNDCVQ